MRRYWLALLGVIAVAGGLRPHRAVPLLVENVRIDPAPPLEGVPTTLLNFGLANKGSDGLTNIVVKVSVVGKRTGVALAGPFTLMGNDRHILRPGQSLNFEIRLRNISPECGCRAYVTVLSAQPRHVDDHEIPLPPTETEPRRAATTAL